MPDPLRFSCPSCNAKLNAPLLKAGKTFPCPRCGEHVRVPGGNPESPVSIDVREEAKDARAKRISVIATTVIFIAVPCWVAYTVYNAIQKANEAVAEMRKSPPTSTADPRHPGQESARTVLAKTLKSPSTADYPWSSVESLEVDAIEGKRRWLVSGDVHSQNSFGAMIRGRWETVIVLDEDAKEYAPLHVSLDGKTIWGDKKFRPKASSGGR